MLRTFNIVLGILSLITITFALYSSMFQCTTKEEMCVCVLALFAGFVEAIIFLHNEKQFS